MKVEGRSVGLQRISLAAVILAGAALPAGFSSGLCRAQVPGSYGVDPQESRIEIHVFRGGLLGGFGDNHVILLRRFSGAATSAGDSWEAHVVAEPASLEVVDPGKPASTREQVERTMLGPTLDVARYKSIELRSRSLVGGNREKSWRMLADLSLHGVTRQVEFPLTWEQNGDRLRVHGTQKLLLRDFNIEPPRVAMGTIKVRDEFELVYDLTLRKQ